jgi:hypothetical protein
LNCPAPTGLYGIFSYSNFGHLAFSSFPIAGQPLPLNAAHSSWTGGCPEHSEHPDWERVAIRQGGLFTDHRAAVGINPGNSKPKVIARRLPRAQETLRPIIEKHIG